MSRHVAAIEQEERRLARWLVTPALVFILVGSLVPIAATGWEALHGHDLRLPWLGRPFVGLENFVEAIHDPRFTSALLHTATFAVVTVPLEIALGLALARQQQAQAIIAQRCRPIGMPDHLSERINIGYEPFLPVLAHAPFPPLFLG